MAHYFHTPEIGAAVTAYLAAYDAVGKAEPGSPLAESAETLRVQLKSRQAESFGWMVPHLNAHRVAHNTLPDGHPHKVSAVQDAVAALEAALAGEPAPAPAPPPPPPPLPGPVPTAQAVAPATPAA